MQNTPLVSAIDAVLQAADKQEITYTSFFDISNDLRTIWGLEVGRRICCSPPRFPAPKRPPPWLFGMSKEFQKDINHIDRKLQGKILEALTDIVAHPVEPRGDTVKPLAAAMRGCWRYRIGDFRLVYLPDEDTGNITLLAFASRGTIYDD
jgi:mRNA-degrading endonuclease RelE of RelBE toxin-antitoxin system